MAFIYCSDGLCLAQCQVTDDTFDKYVKNRLAPWYCVKHQVENQHRIANSTANDADNFLKFCIWLQANFDRLVAEANAAKADAAGV